MELESLLEEDRLVWVTEVRKAEREPPEDVVIPGLEFRLRYVDEELLLKALAVGLAVAFVEIEV